MWYKLQLLVELLQFPRTFDLFLNYLRSRFRTKFFKSNYFATSSLKYFLYYNKFCERLLCNNAEINFLFIFYLKEMLYSIAIVLVNWFTNAYQTTELGQLRRDCQLSLGYLIPQLWISYSRCEWLNLNWAGLFEKRFTKVKLKLNYSDVIWRMTNEINKLELKRK